MERISDDILLTIFEFLDNDSIWTAAEVSKRWYRLISSSTPLTKRPTLAIDISAWKDDNTSSYEMIRTLFGKLDKFPYRNFKLTSNSHLHSREKSTLNVFKDKCQKIEKLCINSFSAGLMLSMLRLAAPTLTHLIISTNFNDEEYEGLADLPNLEYLKINSVNSILKVIKCENLKSLDIVNCQDRRSFNELFKQLNYLPHLKSLTTFETFWMLGDLTTLPFELENLTLTKFSSVESDILHGFLLAQAKSLKTLQIKEKEVLTSTINFVLDNLRNLESLKIHGSLLNARNERKEPKLNNLKLKNLEMKLVTDCFAFSGNPKKNSANDVLQMLSKCKSLEKFKFYGSLSTTNFLESNLPLPSLKIMEIETIDHFSFWNCFELNNLENFTLEAFNPVNMIELLNFLPKMPKLKHLQFNSWSSMNNQRTDIRASEMSRFFGFLKNYESFKVKSFEKSPAKLLNHFSKLQSEKFKLLEISFEKNTNNLGKYRDNFKNVKFQTIFNKSQKKNASFVWEENVEQISNHDEDEESIRVANMFRTFMTNRFFPN